MPVYVDHPSTHIRRLCIVFNSFFLVYAAHVVILGITWRMWAQPDVSHDQSMETTAIGTAIKVLDFCGQRNTFARKYSHLIKGLRSQLDGGPSSAGRTPMTTISPSILSALPSAGSQMIGVRSTSSLGSGSHAYTHPDNSPGHESGANQALPSIESKQRSLSADLDGMTFGPSWLEQLRASDLAHDPLFPGTFL